MSNDLRRYKVFSQRKMKGGVVYVNAGMAFENRDGSFTVHLDVLPLDGVLHLRRPIGESEANAMPNPDVT